MGVSQQGQVGGPGLDCGGQGHGPSLIYNLSVISHPQLVGDCISNAPELKGWPTNVT